MTLPNTPAMPPPGSRAEQIFEDFKRFHREHPRVWELFVRFTLEAIAAGRSKYSARSIVHRIRWHYDIEVPSDEDGFKINNNFSPYYGRYFMYRHPQHEGFFRTRERRSETSRARGVSDGVDDPDPRWTPLDEDNP